MFMISTNLQHNFQKDLTCIASCRDLSTERKRNTFIKLSLNFFKMTFNAATKKGKR